jgi:hypothetical protein
VNHFRVTGDDPGMHVWVPMHRVMGHGCAWHVVKGMRMRQLRPPSLIEKPQEAELYLMVSVHIVCMQTWNDRLPSGQVHMGRTLRGEHQKHLPFIFR